MDPCLLVTNWRRSAMSKRQQYKPEFEAKVGKLTIANGTVIMRDAADITVSP